VAALPSLLALALAAAPPPSAPEWGPPAAHAAALLAGMRLTLGLAWPGTYDPSRLREQGDQVKLAFTRPPELRRDRSLFASDGDPWALNVAGHGLFGSEVYLRARRCGHGALAAVAAAAAVSTAWEYGVESFSKRPSAIDLAWTPVGGALLGELRFRVHRWSRRGGGGRAAVSWLVDPLGEAGRAAFGGC
jgi:hypothetical protein